METIVTSEVVSCRCAEFFGSHVNLSYSFVLLPHSCCILFGLRSDHTRVCGAAVVNSSSLVLAETSSSREKMSVSSPLQAPLVAEETLANGLMQDPGGLAVSVALGVSGDKPCGEKTKMGEETTVEEAQEATTLSTVCVTTDSTTLATTTISTGAPDTNNSSIPPQGTAEVKWSREATEQYLPNFQLSMNKDECGDGRVG